MSINSMANAAIGRRQDYEPVGDVPRTLTDISKAAGGSSAPSNQVTSALNVIVAYIPTEVLTLYVAVVAALGNATGSTSGVHTSPGLTAAFWAFLVATPVTVWDLYGRDIVVDN